VANEPFNAAFTIGNLPSGWKIGSSGGTAARKQRLAAQSEFSNHFPATTYNGILFADPAENMLIRGFKDRCNRLRQLKISTNISDFLLKPGQALC
jgi:hypothetical protein